MTVYNDQVSQYIQSLFVKEDGALRLTRDEAIQNNLPQISVKPEEGRFLQVFVCAMGVKCAVEIGTLSGYSTIWIGRGLAPGGKLISLEKEPLHAELSRKHLAEAGLSDRVEVRLGNAMDMLRELGPNGPYDFVFIDADKGGYPAYMKWAIENVRLGGAIAAHNAFRKGSVAGTAEGDDWTEIMRQVNQEVANNPRLVSTIYPAGDGTLLAVKVG